MIKAIVFDFDGVIVDSEPLHYQAMLETVKPFSFHFDFATYMRDYIGFDDRDAFRTIFSDNDYPLRPEGLDRLITAKASVFKKIVSKGVAALPGAVELITETAAALPIGLCSGALLHDIQLILPNLAPGGLDRKFTAIVTADDVERSKPDPQCYTLTTRRLGLKPQQCVAIEDTAAGLAAARGAGLRTLAVCTSFPAEQLREADHIVQSLTEASLSRIQQWFA